jgi:hypothetical protein
MIFFFLLLPGAPFAAKKSIQSSDPYSTEPFQDQWKSIPSKYNGHDIAAVYRSLLVGYPVKKEESAANGRTEQKTGHDQNKNVVGNMTVRDRFAFVLQQPEKKYDSGNSKFIFEIKHIKSEGIQIGRAHV